jgi:hypothetical protein
MKTKQIILTTFIVLSCSTATFASSLYVPADFHTIQEGIDNAAVGDSVVISCGTYFEFDIRMKPGITVRGETADPDCVIIDADFYGRVMNCDSLAVVSFIEGITFKRGYADVGGGISAVATGLIISDCNFINNQSTLIESLSGGGGIRIRAGSDVIINNCLFKENEAYRGGGLHSSEGCIVELNNCEFIENLSPVGAALLLDNGSSTVRNCIISRNHGISHAGGAMVAWGEALFENCIFYLNDTWYLNRDNQQERSTNRNLMDTAGLVAANTVDEVTTIRNCTFANNYLNQIFCYFDSTMVIENTIIAPGGFSVGGNPLIECTNIYGHNGGSNWVGDFEDQAGINGNISEDPLYCGPLSYPDFDLTLMDNSPCAPENSSGCGLIGACPVACYESAIGVVPDSELLSILSCYPNPFNPSTTISYHMIESGYATLKVFDLKGKLVEVLLETNIEAGDYNLVWHPENLGSGVYKVFFETGNQTISISLLLIK